MNAIASLPVFSAGAGVALLALAALMPRRAAAAYATDVLERPPWYADAPPPIPIPPSWTQPLPEPPLPPPAPLAPDPSATEPPVVAAPRDAFDTVAAPETETHWPALVDPAAAGVAPAERAALADALAALGSPWSAGVLVAAAAEERDPLVAERIALALSAPRAAGR